MEEVRKSGSIRPDAGVIGERLREVAALSRDFAAHLGRSLAVNATDLAAMEFLVTEGPLSPSELARQLGVSTAASTLVVDRLVALGHARRTPHSSDRRKTVVVPMDESVGRVIAELSPILGGISTLTQGMSREERFVVETFLAGVVEVYRAALTPNVDIP